MSRSFLVRAASVFSLVLVLAALLPGHPAAQQRYPRKPQCGKGPASWFSGSASFRPGDDTLAAVLRLVAAASVEHPRGVFLLVDDSAGAPPKALLFESNLPDSIYPRLQQIAGAYHRSHPVKRGRRVFFFMDLGANGDLVPEDHEVQYCTPHLRNLQTIQAYMERAADLALTYEDLREGEKGLRGMISILLDRDGNVLWADARPGTGNKTVDDNYIAIVSKMQFTPGTIDGEPRVFLTLIPMTIEAW